MLTGPDRQQLVVTLATAEEIADVVARARERGPFDEIIAVFTVNGVVPGVSMQKIVATHSRCPGSFSLPLP